jgi:hypothetical protein
MAAAFTPDFIKRCELQQQFSPRPLDEGWLNFGSLLEGT